MLTADRWNRLQNLFEVALDLPPAELARFVAAHTSDDPTLGEELAAMLGHASTGGERIASVVSSVADLAAPVDDWVGRQFGGYRIVREIGRGGMGLVFEASRADDEFRKRVALKIAPWWRNVGLLTERFRLERQILANLDHPNISRFLDGGTENGVPYFVMEYVEGVTITEYCKSHSTDIRQRIELVRQVCSAVQFAHQHLVVHRDIKPANILVDESGTPKLLDFGIAKLLDPLADGSVTSTGVGVWTPDYASPEQVRGLSVTTRSDVYSLGLVLYELLTGERAQRADQSSPVALDRSVCDIDPLLPSECLTAKGARAEARRVRGDLDTIVMTALRKEPDRRYGSVAAFSDDLARSVTGQPVVARPNTRMYRTLKFVRRHRVGVAASVVLAISMGAGLSTSLYEARRAERHFQQVRALANTFVFDVHDSIERLAGATEARRAIVRTALTYLENLRVDADGDAALSRELAQAYIKIGNVQGNPVRSNLGDAAGAMASFRQAQNLLRPLADRGDHAAAVAVTQAGHHLATVQWAQNEQRAALATLDDAAAVGERVLAAAPGDRDALTVLGDVYSQRTRFATTMRDFAGAAADADRVMQAARQLLAIDSADKGYLSNLSTAYNAVGAARILAGQIEDAANAFRESAAIRERLVKDNPTDTEFRRNLIIAYGNLGDVLGYRTGENLGDPSGAASVFEKAIALAEEATRVDAQDRRAAFDLASAKLRLGAVLADIPGQERRAIDVLQEADRLNGALSAQDPTSARYALNAIAVGLRLAGAETLVGNRAEAARRLGRVRTLAARFLDGPTGATARAPLVVASAQLAVLKADAGDATAAEMADFVVRELGTQPLGGAVNNADAYFNAGRAYLRVSARFAGANRERFARDGIAALTKSEELWRGARLPAGLETRRTSALAAIAADLSAARKLSDS